MILTKLPFRKSFYLFFFQLNFKSNVLHLNNLNPVPEYLLKRQFLHIAKLLQHIGIQLRFIAHDQQRILAALDGANVQSKRLKTIMGNITLSY